MDPDYPGVPGIIVGLIAFVIFWIYAIANYGWFLGIGLGWLPAMFLAIIAAYLWPLIVLAMLIAALGIAWLAVSA